MFFVSLSSTEAGVRSSLSIRGLSYHHYHLSAQAPYALFILFIISRYKLSSLAPGE
jgi:hypothetical protein